MIEGYEGCKSCPLSARPAVMGKGARGGIAVVGEAPGVNEVAQKCPFVGASGKLLRPTLRQAGVDPEMDVWYTNTVLCRPLDNAVPPKEAVECCRQRLMDELYAVRPQKILLCGATAAKALLGVNSITTTRGLGTRINLGPIETIGEEDLATIDLEPYTIATYHPSAVLRTDELYRDFAADITKLVLNDRPYDLPYITTVICKTVDQALEELQFLSTATEISCDLETTGLSPITEQILSVGFGALCADNVGYNVIVPFWILPYLEEEIKWFVGGGFPGRVAFWNIKFDIQFLAKWLDSRKLQPLKPVDVMLLQYAQDERGADEETSSNNRGYATKGLKDQARLRYDLPDYHFDWKKFFAVVLDENGELVISNETMELWENLFNYQGLDTYFTLRILRDIEPELDMESPRLRPMVEEILLPVTLALSRVEMNGAPLDREYLEGLKVQTNEKLDVLVARLRVVAEKVGIEDLNPNSNPKIHDILRAIGFNSESGEKEALLMEMRKDDPPYEQWIIDFVRDLLDYRQRSKVLGTYIEGMLKRMDYDDRVRPDFLPHGTPTGRLACRGPNLQNIPALMGPEIRNAFIAPYGYIFVNADYSQLELRVAAWYSRDENLTEAFLTGKDVHRWVAALMFKKPEAEITKLERYLAKYLDFGLIYGRGARGITEGWEAEYIVDMGGKRWTLKEAEQLTDDFFNAFPKLRGFIERQHQFVRAHHYVETPTGRRRRFPYLSNQTVGSVERKAVNTPIQSLASDMTLHSIIELDKRLPDGAEIISTVHDSIMFIVREDLESEVIPLIQEIMSTPCIPEFDIPLKADVEVGRYSEGTARWGMLVKD